MSEYKRLTKRGEPYYAFNKCKTCEYGKDGCDKWCDQIRGCFCRLQELEDKIENGTLVEFPFIVVDKRKNKETDCYNIALKEDWAKDLCYCDMDGFAITQDGMLILLDECGRYTSTGGFITNFNGGR